MEFYFPPKEKSVALLQAEEKLVSKGYAFSKEKRMCRYDQDNQRLDENKGFVFEVRKGDKAYNQKNYEEIGEILTDYVYGLLESDPMNLVRKEVQKDEDSEGIYNSRPVYKRCLNHRKIFNLAGLTSPIMAAKYPPTTIHLNSKCLLGGRFDSHFWSQSEKISEIKPLLNRP